MLSLAELAGLLVMMIRNNQLLFTEKHYTLSLDSSRDASKTHERKQSSNLASKSLLPSIILEMVQRVGVCVKIESTTTAGRAFFASFQTLDFLLEFLDLLLQIHNLV